MAAALILPLLMLAATGRCGEQAPPKPQTAVQQALEKCGPGCVDVTFFIDLFDEKGLDVPKSDGFLGNATVDALGAPVNGVPVQIDVWDVTMSHLTHTPYQFGATVPHVSIQIASPNIVQLAFSMDMSLPGGWTLVCTAYEGGRQVSRHEVKNIDPILPEFKEVFCSWPGIDLPGPR